jgi:tetratricopeptide (TPR) repeat protein
MPNPLPSGRLSFEENIGALLEELELAARWDRPSLLLAVHKSKFGQDRAETALEERLAKLGHRVVRITVDKHNSDIPHRIAAQHASPRIVYFVSNLDWGGGEDRRDAYRSLNIYRELFVDQHIRAIFWLTTSEAANLARFAPDFWAFRHRVIEFTGERIPHQVSLPAGVLLWELQSAVDPYDTLEARIAVREQLLARLPLNNEARSARIDLLNNLGCLYWLKGDSSRASELLAEGLRLAGTELGGQMRASLLNGQAVIAYEAGQYQRAVELLQSALRDGPDDALLLINLSAVSSALGRNQDALLIAKKAVKAGPRDARVWSTLGYIYAATGKYDEAIPAFSKAVDLAPRLAAHHLALAICYDLLDRSDETVHQLELARQLAYNGERLCIDISQALLEDDPGKATELAQAAVHAGKLLAADVRRDPNLSLLVDGGQLQQMLA